MTNPTKRLIEELSQMPDDRQDEVAALLLKRLQELRQTNTWPLGEMIGGGAGLYETPEEVDDEIDNQREEWDY